MPRRRHNFPSCKCVLHCSGLDGEKVAGRFLVHTASDASWSQTSFRSTTCWHALLATDVVFADWGLQRYRIRTRNTTISVVYGSMQFEGLNRLQAQTWPVGHTFINYRPSTVFHLPKLVRPPLCLCHPWRIMIFRVWSFILVVSLLPMRLLATTIEPPHATSRCRITIGTRCTGVICSGRCCNTPRRLVSLVWLSTHLSTMMGLE